MFKMFGKTRESIYDAKIEILRPENGVNIDLVGYKIIWMRWQLSCKKNCSHTQRNEIAERKNRYLLKSPRLHYWA